MNTTSFCEKWKQTDWIVTTERAFHPRSPEERIFLFDIFFPETSWEKILYVHLLQTSLFMMSSRFHFSCTERFSESDREISSISGRVKGALYANFICQNKPRLFPKSLWVFENKNALVIQALCVYILYGTVLQFSMAICI